MKNVYFLFLVFSLPLSVLSQDASDLYDELIKSTVTIYTDNGLGSGFFVARNILATNLHVIYGSTYAYCLVSGSEEQYEIEGFLALDPESDLILLSVKGISRPPIMLSESKVSPGQKIYVVGSPRGLTDSFSDGIVSAVRYERNTELIQFTAPVSPGNSGGPVVDSQGKLVGVCVGQHSGGQNLNFAISKRNLQNLIQKPRGKVFDLSALENIIDNSEYFDNEIVVETKSQQSKGIKKVWPVILDVIGDRIVVEIQDFQPSVTEECGIFVVSDGEPVLIGIGNVVNVSGNRCTIELRESTGDITEWSDFYVIFEKEVDD